MTTTNLSERADFFDKDSSLSATLENPKGEDFFVLYATVTEAVQRRFLILSGGVHDSSGPRSELARSMNNLAGVFEEGAPGADLLEALSDNASALLGAAVLGYVKTYPIDQWTAELHSLCDAMCETQ